VEVRVSSASAVVVQQVPLEAVDWFMEWQRGVSKASETFAGYRGADVYLPVGGTQGEWVVVIHFIDQSALQCWLTSPVRQEWVDKLQAKIGGFRLTTLAGGFAAWFAGLARGTQEMPPSWKMVVTVLLGLYPTVMLLTLFVGPYTNPLGLALSMLIGNALSVALLQWAVMPVLTALLGPWLKANGKQQRLLSIGGFLVILLVLVGLAVLFRLTSG